MDSGFVRALVAHAHWANRRVLTNLRAAGPADRPRLLLSHLLAAEQIWLSRIRGEPHPGIEVWPELSLDECADLVQRNATAYRDLVESVSPSDLDRVVAYRTSGGREYETKLIDILIHVALHGSHHRGQIAVAVRELGRAPENTDYITYVREGAPPATGSAG